MKNQIIVIFTLLILIACQANDKKTSNVITSDINRFWTAYDTISNQTDSLKQLQLLEDLYLSKGTPGLDGMIEAKRYRPEEFIEMINRYPKFLESVRANTLKADQLSDKLEAGIEKLSAIYPELRPAKIYFTLGAMRSGGTTMDSLVLIGSELAMVDEQTDISEFTGRMKSWAENYIATKPLENIVLLNVHEYVHTQQKPIPNTLLYQCLYEGIAEFVSVKAMGGVSSSPAIAYGKKNNKVKEVFEKEMFYERTFEWLWSNAPNQFEVRDLGYYIGYAISELHYENATDKQKAVKEMIELDYSTPDAVDAFIDNTNFFTQAINVLRTEDENKRPKVVGIKQFENGTEEVNPKLEAITVEFSKPLNGHNTGVDYGDLGQISFPKILDRSWSEDAKAWTMKVELEPGKRYQILISNNFRTEDNIPLRPYLIDFKTAEIK